MTGRRWTHRARAAVAACAAAFCVASVGLSAAAFSDTASVSGNTTATGAVDIATDTASLFPVQNITPGDTVTRPLTVTNTGTTDLRYAMRATTTENTLAAALTLTIKNRNLTDASCAAFDGLTLYSGPLGSTTTGNQIGDPATGAHLYDRVVGRTTGTDRLCLRVSLPLSSTLASVTTTATFEFLAEQTANNGPAYTSPPVTGIATARLRGGVPDVITVPAGVTSQDLGVLVLGTDGGNAVTLALPGWTIRSVNPAGQNNMGWALATRMGGVTAGDVLNLTVTNDGNGYGNPFITVAWFNTGGRDITAVSPAWTRNAVSQSINTLNGLTTTQPGTDVLVVSSERTLANGTTVTNSAGVTPLFFQENTDTAVSHFIGTFAQSAAGATGTRTITYASGSGNGAGLLLALELPSATT